MNKSQQQQQTEVREPETIIMQVFLNIKQKNKHQDEDTEA